MSLKTKGINNKNEKSDYFESNLLLIEENIDKLSLLENEKEKKIFALKRKIKETQDKKNKFIGKTFKTIEDVDSLREICKQSNEVELLEAIERTLQGLKNDLVKSGVEPLKNIEDIINTIDNEERFNEKKYNVQPQLHSKPSKRRKKKNIKLIPIAIILILGGSFITLLNQSPKPLVDKISDNQNEVMHNEESQTMDRVDDKNELLISIEPVKEDKKLVYKDEKGHTFIPESYEDLAQFSEDIAKVRLKEGYILIDKEGNIVTKEEYKQIESFDKEFVAVQKQNNNWIFIDKSGKVITNEEYKKVEPFTDERAAVQKQNNNWVFIDKYGEERTNNKEYKNVKPFSEGIAEVQLDNNQWIHIDKYGLEKSDDVQTFNDSSKNLELKGKTIKSDKSENQLKDGLENKNNDKNSQNIETKDSKNTK